METIQDPSLLSHGETQPQVHFSSVLVESVRNFLSVLPRGWKLFFVAIGIPILVLAFIDLLTYLNLRSLGMLILLIYLFIDVFIIGPAFFFTILRLLKNPTVHLTWHQLLVTGIEGIKNRKTFTTLGSFTGRLLGIGLNIQLVTALSNLGKPSDLVNLYEKQIFERYYPWLMKDTVPFLLADGKDINQIFHLKESIPQESKEAVYRYIYDEAVFFLFWGFLLLVIAALLWYTVGHQLVDLIISFVYKSKSYSSWTLMWLIMLPYFLLRYAFSLWVFCYHYSVYKYFWSKYLK